MDLVFKNLIQHKMTADTQKELQKDLSLHYRIPSHQWWGTVWVCTKHQGVFFKDSNLHILSCTL